MKIYNVIEPPANISMAATIIEPLEKIADLQKIRGSNIYVGVDPELNVLTFNGRTIGKLAQLLSADALTAIPVLSIEDPATIRPLAGLLKTEDRFDITLISSQPQLIKQARDLLPLIRGAVDYSGYDFSSIKNPLQFITQQTNRAKAKIALLPAQFNSKEEVESLQKRLLTVWSVDHGGNLTDSVAMLSTGVNGIISHNTTQLLQAMRCFKKHSLLRKPIIIGHRGIPSLLPENTLAGAIKAYQLGVDAIEYDIQLSADNQIVVMHDENVERTTNATGLIEKMTLAEIKALRIKDGDTISEYSVPTLNELFAQFADTPLFHFIEIKSNRAEIIKQLKAAIEKYKLAEQVIVISFKEAQLSEMFHLMPEISIGFLSDFITSCRIDKNLQQILSATQRFSSTFNPDYKNLTTKIMAAAKHRGTTFWTWTYRNKKDAQYYYVQGTHGLTSDYAQWFTDLPVYLRPSSQSTTIRVGQPLKLTMEILTQAGASFAAKAMYTLIESDADYADSGGILVFKTPGQASVLLSHRHQMSEGQSYYIYSSPILVTIIAGGNFA